MDTVITNGKLVTPWTTIEGVTIGVEGEKVACVCRGDILSTAQNVIDAHGKPYPSGHRGLSYPFWCVPAL